MTHDFLDWMLEKKSRTLLGLAGLVLAIGSIGTCAVSPHLSRDNYVGTVTEKLVKRYDKKDKYLVFTKLQDSSVRVFENTDSFLEGKWDSSDIQAQIEPGKKYEFRTYGWRIPFFSFYENILSAREISKEEKK